MTDSTENDVQPSAESKNLEVISDKDKFYIEFRKFYDNRVDGTTKPEWTKERINAVINSIEQFNTASVPKQPKTQQQYRNAKKYDVMSVGEEKLLILRRKDLNSPVVQVPSTDMYYDILLQAHISAGHGGRDKLIYNLKQQYVIPVPIMILFLNLCKICLNKKSCPNTGIVVRPIISQDFNKRGQVDLIDLQSTPSQNYKWILNYQDHLTKFCFLRPLTSKKETEVAMALLKIFLEVGAPMILQSDNGKEFTASIIKELITLWPACKIVNGRPRHPQSQGTSTMLSFITLASSQAKTLPKVSYIKASEIWFLGCIGFIFAALVEFAFVNTIWRRKKLVSLKKVNSKYILKSTLTPRLARKELQKELQESSPQLTKSRSCSSLNQDTSSDPAGPGYNNYLTVHSFPSAMNLPTITTQSYDDLIQGPGGAHKSPGNGNPNGGAGSDDSDEPPRHHAWTQMTPQEIATWIDKRSRIMFPVLFIFFNIIYWTFVYCL